MDVVPYVTKVTTGLSSAYKKNRETQSTVARTSLGYYPVRRGETIQIEGFNLSGTDTGVSVNGTAISGITLVTAGNQNEIKVPVVASSLSSGDIEVTVNSIGSLNNKNNNDSVGSFTTTLTTDEKYEDYPNREPNKLNNNILTDDRKVYLIDVYTTTDTNDKRKVDMVVNGNTINFACGYTDNAFSEFIGANGTSLGTTARLRGSYTRYFESAMAMNASGTAYTVSSCGDTLGVPVTSWSSGPSHFALTRGNSTLTTGNNEYDDANTSMIFLESNWNGANFNNLDRVQWPSMKVSGDNTLSKIYLSYYDTTQKIIKFRYIENGASVTSGYTTDNRFGSKTTQIMYTAGATRTYYVEQAISVYTSGGKTYDQGYVCIAGADSNSPYSAVNFTNDGTAIVSWYDAKNGVLKMKYNTSPATSFSGYQTFSTVPGTGTVTFKISVDGGAAKDASVTYSNVANGQRNNHEFAYQLGKYLSENGFGAYAEVDPKSNLVTVRSMQTGPGSSISITNLSNGAVNAGVTGCGNAWVERTIDDAAAGKFVALEVDGKNGIHMAYNDTANGDLKYAYLSSGSGTPQVVTVDGYQQTGSYIDLALKNETLDGTSCIVPYISYYCTSYTDSTNAARVARLRKPLIPSATGSDATFTSANGAGAVDDMLTDIWEVVAIPTAGIPDQYRVNIGVKTNGDVIVGYLADKQIEYVKVW